MVCSLLYVPFFLYEIRRSAFHFCIYLANIHSRNAHTCGDDSTNKPERHEHGSPSLDGFSLAVLNEGKHYHGYGDQCHGQSYVGNPS